MSRETKPIINFRQFALKSVDNQDDLRTDYTELQQYKLDGGNFRLFQKATVGCMATLGKALMQNGKQ